MELLLNINQYGYSAFLDSNVDTFILGFKDFCSGYLMYYELDDFPRICKYIHEKEKKIYASFNILANETKLQELEKIMNQIKNLEVDGFVISDFGILQLFIEHDLSSKIIFNPITTITNKYSAKIANDMGINHVCLANELNLKDILEISSFNNGNVEILAHGYYQIGMSKRPLLTHFLKKFKKRGVKETSHYYIKEESRDYAYPILEAGEDLLIYIDKQRAVLPYLKDIIEANVNFLRIDTVFLEIDQINTIVEAYNLALKDLNNIDTSLKMLKENTNSNFSCLDNISLLTKGEIK